MNGFHKSLLTALLSGSVLTLAACGGGGGGSSSSGGTVTGLEMPTKLSIVTAQEDATSKISGISLPYKTIAGAVVNTSGYGATSAYATDETRTHVYDPSMEPLSIVNEILCYMEQTRASDMVNEGAYIALINEDKCQEGQNQSGGGSGGAQGSSSSNTQATTYAKWVIESTRTDNAAPQYVKIWVPGEPNPQDPMDGQNILVEVTVNEGVSASKPFGDFVLNFKGVVDSGLLGLPAGNQVTTMVGTLKTVDNAEGKPQFQFINLGGQDAGVTGAPFSMTQKTNVIMDDASGTSGMAMTNFSEWFDQNGNSTEDTGERKEAKFAVGFNTGYFLRGKDTNGDSLVTSADDQVCTDRTNYNTQVWRYNLYNAADGSRVSLNSGFPFNYTDGNGSHFGHIGYWGIWTEDGLSLTDLDGQTITKETFGQGAGSAPTYTVNVSGGKLWKRTREAATFAELVGVDMNWYGDPADPFCASGCASQGDYRATVVDNGGSYSVKATATLTWTDSGPQTTDITPVDITPASTSTTGQQLWMWSDALGGSVVVKSDGVTFFREEVVSPSDVPAGLQLVCFENCVKGGIGTSVTVASEADMFWIQWNSSTGTSNSHTYNVQVANGKISLLDESSNAVTLPASFDPVSLGLPDWYQWGIHTGEMVTTTDALTLANWWDIYNSVNVTYRWESGNSDWNRQVTLTDAGSQLVTFDKPIQLPYTYEAGDDPNVDPLLANHPAGNKYLLEYGGGGELWGFPWQPEDPTCDPSTDNCRWVSALTLKSGVGLTGADSTQYVVKQIEREQTMVKQPDTSSCTAAGLNIDNVSLPLPSTVDGQVSIAWSGRPAVTDAPAVIEGELQ